MTGQKKYFDLKIRFDSSSTLSMVNSKTIQMSDDTNAMGHATMATEGMPMSPDVGDLMAVDDQQESRR